MAHKNLPHFWVLPTVELTAGRSVLAEATMGYREAREVAQIRQELRLRLMSAEYEGAEDVLARFRFIAFYQSDEGEREDPDLRSEYERWKVRFELLSANAHRN
jgi:hypothetical protein